MRHDFLQGIDQNVARWNSGSPENCQRCTTQHGSRKRYRRPSAFSNLNEAGLRGDDGKLLAHDRGQKRFCRAAPHVINHDLKTRLTGFTQKCLAEVLRGRVEVNGRVSTELVQGAQNLLVASRSNNATRAEKLRY